MITWNISVSAEETPLPTSDFEPVPTRAVQDEEPSAGESEVEQQVEEVEEEKETEEELEKSEGVPLQSNGFKDVLSSEDDEDSTEVVRATVYIRTQSQS